jgi:hypothetical protein
MFTKDEYVIVCYNIHDIKDAVVDGINPAYTQLEPAHARQLGISNRFTQTQVEMIHAQWRCHDDHKDRLDKATSNSFILDIIIPGIYQRIMQKFPTFLRQMGGSVRKWVPEWLAKGAKSTGRISRFLIENRIILAAATAIYSIVKMVLCIYTMKAADMSDVVTYLGVRSTPLLNSLTAIFSMGETVISCTSPTGWFTCMRNIGVTLLRSFGVIGKLATVIAETFFGENTSIDTLTEYTPANWYQIWKTPGLEAVNFLHSRAIFPNSIVTAMVQVSLPDVGFRILDFLVRVFGSWVPGVAEMVHTLKDIIRAGGPELLANIKQLLILRASFHAQCALIRFFMTEMFTLSKCMFVPGGRCCFSESFATDFAAASPLIREHGTAIHEL